MYPSNIASNSSDIYRVDGAVRNAEAGVRNTHRLERVCRFNAEYAHRYRSIWLLHALGERGEEEEEEEASNAAVFLACLSLSLPSPSYKEHPPGMCATPKYSFSFFFLSLMGDL